MKKITMFFVAVCAMLMSACSSARHFNFATDETYVRLKVGSIVEETGGMTRIDLYYRNINLYTAYVDTSRCTLERGLLSTQTFRFAKVAYADGSIRYFPEEPNRPLEDYILINYCY